MRKVSTHLATLLTFFLSLACGLWKAIFFRKHAALSSGLIFQLKKRKGKNNLPYLFHFIIKNYVAS